MSSHFDAIDYAQQLEAAGVPKSQAEVHAKTLAQVLNSCAASPADLQALDERLDTRLKMFEDRIVARMDAFEARVDLKLEVMRGQINRMQVLLGINTAALIAILVKTYFP